MSHCASFSGPRVAAEGMEVASRLAGASCILVGISNYLNWNSLPLLFLLL